jgi:hypothetical protein
MSADFLEHNIVGFFTGVVIIFAGVYLLAPRKRSRAAAAAASATATVDDGTDSSSSRQRSYSSGGYSEDGLMVLLGDNEQEEAESQQVFWEHIGLESLIPTFDGVFETNVLDWAVGDN